MQAQLSINRYANMDYTFASLMRHHTQDVGLVVSYDIACQWSKSIFERLKKLPPMVRLQLITGLIRFAVPKLHIHSHTRHCQENYSLNYLPGVGRTDGEGIERPWANIGATATSTRVMGPGSRIETLNDHWSHWNWQKTVGLGTFNALPSSCTFFTIARCPIAQATSFGPFRTLDSTSFLRHLLSRTRDTH